MQNIAVYNNVFVATGGAPLISVPAKYSAFFAGNLYWTSGGPFKIFYQGKTYSSLEEWRGATDNELLKGIATGTTADPRLTNLGTAPIAWPRAASSIDAYRAQKGSPTIDNGVDLSKAVGIDQGTRDFFGIDVPSQNGYDIGAHEYSSTDTARNKPPVIMQLRDTSMAMSSLLDIPFRIKDEAPYKVLCNVTVPQSVLFPQGSARVFGNGPIQTLRIQPAEGKTGVEEIIVGATDEWDATNTVRIRVTVGSTTSVEELDGSGQKMHAWVDGASLHVKVPEGEAGAMNCDLFSASSSEVVQSTSQTVSTSSSVVSMPLDGLASGVYMVRVQRGSSVRTEKFVICR
jgi:hypothetical protein